MTGNYFLDALKPETADAVRAILQPVDLADGDVLIHQEAEVAIVHFPTSAQLSNITVLPSGDHLETAVIGKEGLSGLAPFMASAPCAWRVVSTVGGSAWAAPAEDLRALSDRLPDLRVRLLALTHFYQAQANQLALCNTYHRAPSRLARWLLMTSDLTGVSELRMTQEQIANALGVQRTAMVEAFGALKAEGLIKHTRARMAILDRAGLRRRACGCYAQLHRMALSLGILPGNR
ncbi:MAG: Crp/Fnr family transcriptional regulator [Brevundimonas sp.]|nr:Crp/Fnr family transcriptional regulator [Brevundimonas sp.]